MTLLPSEAKFDIREDEEQYQKLQDCVDLLVACGYFRARIKGLSAFDKIVGGMVWCISTCNYSVDVNLLYAENATIGQKIALTEKIVDVLPKLNCPHTIEPHQIQGLDFIHIFPVIQWLVRKAIEAKEAHGDALEEYAQYMYDTKVGTLPQPSTLTKTFNALNAVPPERKFRRGQGVTVDSIHEDALCTLAEFQSTDTTSSEAVNRDGLEATSLRDRLTTKAIRSVIDTVTTVPSTEKYEETAEEELDRLDREIADALLEQRNLDLELDNEKKRYEGILQEAETLESEEAKRRTLLESVSPEDIEELESLLLDYEQIAGREKEFKVQCRIELADLDRQIAEAHRITEMGEEAVDDELEAEIEQAEKALANTREQAAQVSREVSSLQRRLDSVPSQIEMAQYQQRFIELYNQMASKHRETKQYYTLHNTLIDLRDYMQREVEMLSKIEDVLPMATKDEYRDSFVQNLDAIFKSVEKSVNSLTSKADELEKKKRTLTAELSAVKAHEKNFLQYSEIFQKECKRNEELRQVLKAKDIEY